MTSELVDIRDHQMPFFDQRPPAFTKRDYPNDVSAALGRTIDHADGFVILTPEFEMAPLRHAVHVLPTIMQVAREHPDTDPLELFAPLEPRLTMLLDDLVWWTEALAVTREATA